MDIHVNRLTETVQLQPSPFTFKVEVSDDFNPSKTVTDIDGNTMAVSFQQNAILFTLQEVLQAKYQDILDNSNYDYIIADMFLNEDDLDLTDINHSANTGVALVQLLPQGQVKTKDINLEVPSKDFELLEGVLEGVDIYINDVKFINNKLSLVEDVGSVVIKFINTTDKFVNLKSYAIAY